MKSDTEQKSTWYKMQHEWKYALVFVALALIVGALVGIGITKATSAAGTTGQSTTSERYPVCDNCSKARVKSRSMGRHKFRDDKLGHAKHHAKYRHKFKRIVSHKLARKLNHQSSKQLAGFGFSQAERRLVTPAEAWDVFVRNDSCIAAGTLYFFEQDPVQKAFYGTCEGGAYLWKTVPSRQISVDDIGVALCGVSAAVAYLSVDEPGPWTPVGVGAGSLGCFWGTLITKAG